MSSRATIPEYQPLGDIVSIDDDADPPRHNYFTLFHKTK